MKSFCALLLIASTISMVAGAAKGAPKKKADDPQLQTKPQMHALATEISALQRFLLSEADFTNPKNAAAISHSVDSMQKHLQELYTKTCPFSQDPALKANMAMLDRHMSEVQKEFKAGNKPFARYMLQSSLSMCISCHTRGKVQWDFALPGDKPGQKISDLDRADFLFATRQFDKGKMLYEKVSDGYPDNRITRIQLQHALDSLAVYFARVKEDTKAGERFFRGVSRESWLSDLDQKQFRAWSDYFAAWNKEKKPVLKTPEEFLAEAKRVLGSDDLKAVAENRGDAYVRRLRASALLHQALEAPGDEHMPAKGESLYLLGLIYQRLNHQFFFRFGEMYLRACVEEYQHTPVAKTCYEGLSDAVLEGYTGSAGTSVPAAEQAELDRLKKLAF